MAAVAAGSTNGGVDGNGRFRALGEWQPVDAKAAIDPAKQIRAEYDS
jgi:hypothetical protein